MSRAGAKGNRKLILLLIQERTLLLVSGCIESSAFSLSLSLAVPSLSLSPSFSFLPSFSLSLLPVLAFLPWVVTRSLGKCTQNKFARSAVTVRICMFVRSCKNLHTCKLPLAGSRSPLVKYARGSHIGFRSTSQTCSFMRASNAQVRYLHNPLMKSKTAVQIHKYEWMYIWNWKISITEISELCEFVLNSQSKLKYKQT